MNTSFVAGLLVGAGVVYLAIGTRSRKRPYVERLSPRQIRSRNAKAIRMLDSLEEFGDEQEQRETLEALRKAMPHKFNREE